MISTSATLGSVDYKTMGKQNKIIYKVKIKEFKEEYKEYRDRKRENYIEIKYYKKGEYFWQSLARGTFRKIKTDE